MNNSSANSHPFFETNLMLSLKLESDGKEAEVVSGNIEGISLNLHSYGHICSVQFTAFDEDEIDQMFTAPKIIKATIAFKPTDPKEGSAPLLEIKGIITDKCFKRMPSALLNSEKPVRMYEIYFCDNAKVTWSQHFPLNIYLDESMKDVIEKHINPEITMMYDWDTLEVKHPITAFSLEHKYWLPENQQTSFYSFLIWYLRQENGILAYDYKNHSYKITGKKGELSGPPLEVYEWCALPPLCIFPQTPRYNSKVINHSSNLMDAEDKENQNSFTSVRRESIDSSNYRVYPEQASEKMQSTLVSEKNEIELEITNFKEKLQIDKLTPGSFLCFKGDKGGNWSSDVVFKEKNFRIRSLSLEAHKLSISEELKKPLQAFQLYVKIKLETEDETFVEWPGFIPPTYPFYIQGKIFSDVGDVEQSTYKILELENAPQGQYLVQVPLAGEEKRVVAPFVPSYSGQYYYPFCKDAKVMLSMHFRTAKIERPIEWDPLARLPVGVQGNQIVLASNTRDKYVIIRHEFVDGKDSVFTIKQSSSETQTQTLTIKEKDTIITVEEKDKKTLFIQLNNEKGLILSLEDKTAAATQQTVFDGKSMTHTCKGSEGTSTIVQKSDSISMECKEFTIKSDTIVLEAKDSISQTGKNKVNIESKVANVCAPSVKLG